MCRIGVTGSDRPDHSSASRTSSASLTRLVSPVLVKMWLRCAFTVASAQFRSEPISALERPSATALATSSSRGLNSASSSRAASRRDRRRAKGAGRYTTAAERRREAQALAIVLSKADD